jgi:hypothetical protein
MSSPVSSSNNLTITFPFSKEDVCKALPRIVEVSKPYVIALGALALFAAFFALYVYTLPTNWIWEPIGYWLEDHFGTLTLLSGLSTLGSYMGVNALFDRYVTPWAKELAAKPAVVVSSPLTINKEPVDKT